MSMPAGVATVEIIVLTAALDLQNISVSRPVSRQSRLNSRFFIENRLFCSGGAGFELGDFVL